MRSIVRIGGGGKRSGTPGSKAVAELSVLGARVELIQALIPLGLEAVQALLEQEVTALAGARYQRGGGVPGYARWGGQDGSVYLADQKVAVRVPRVRDVRRAQEVPPSTYQGLRRLRRAEEATLRKVLKGLSCRSYEACVEPVAETFGLTASSLSRRFKRASARKLAELQERDLSGYDLVGLFLDGKTFGDDEMVIALGVTLSGEKVVLGFVQTATENEAVCTSFLRGLVERGLTFDRGLLVVLDGAKGLRKAVDKVFGKKAAVQRCRWHKRENVPGYLSEGLKPMIQRKLNAAYEKPTCAAAKTALQRIQVELAAVNAWAAARLEEGLEEMLTLHRLGLVKELGRSFKTTNCIENVNALVGQRTDQVDCWRNADQKHRWLGTALPTQTHHGVRKGGEKWRAKYQEILDKYNLSVLDEWNQVRMPHLGRHPEKYYEWIYQHLERADTFANGDQGKFLTYMKDIVDLVQEHAEVLLKEYYWGR